VRAGDGDAAADGEAEFGDAGLAGSFDPRDPIDRDDIAAVDPQKRLRIEPRLKRAERSELNASATAFVKRVAIAAANRRKRPRRGLKAEDTRC